MEYKKFIDLHIDELSYWGPQHTSRHICRCIGAIFCVALCPISCFFSCDSDDEYDEGCWPKPCDAIDDETGSCSSPDYNRVYGLYNYINLTMRSQVKDIEKVPLLDNQSGDDDDEIPISLEMRDDL